jgi:signal transduction histidine kinase
MDAVVYVADMESHEILFTNNYVENVFGNILGKKCYEALQEKKEPCEFCTNHLLVDKNGKANHPYIWEFQNLITKQWYQCHDQAISWTDGKLVRFETATDITQNKENEQKLKEHEIKLQELNATKDKFFSIIAHDLKNPFTVLKNGSYLLAKHLENNDLIKSKEKAMMISNATKNTYELLDNLLLWAKSQTASMELDIRNLNLKSRLIKNIKEVENLASQKNISIINEVKEDFTLEADENLLSAVFRNLITNAIKFTNSGGEVTIKAELADNHIEIAVIDTGIGIPLEHQYKLFRLDVNYSRVGTEKEVSTGLGLILCKEFVEKHNGKIWFESEVEKGSIFKVKLPLKQ